MLQSIAAGLMAACVAVAPAAAHDMSQHMQSMGSQAATTCRAAVLSCAISATPAFNRTGALRLIYSVEGRMYVARSLDEGKTFEPALALNEAPVDIDDNFDGRPTIAIAPDGTIATAWSVWRDKKTWAGQVLTSFSKDDGKTFSTPKPITESVSQRFATIGFAPDNTLWATWLDKRNLAAAKASGDDYEGAGLAVSLSRDGGAHFTDAKIVSDRTCECCRVSIAFDTDGSAIAAWRQIFGKNIRDHEVGRLAPDGAKLEGVRVSEDNWAIDACPHHGPNLSIGADGVRHIVWFTGGKTRSGLFYAHETGQGAAFSEPQAFGDPQRAPSHPQVLASGSRLARAWKEFDGEHTAIMLQTSVDGGEKWTAPEAVATTADSSDHPLLIAHDGRMYLSWLTKAEGYRLMPINAVGER